MEDNLIQKFYCLGDNPSDIGIHSAFLHTANNFQSPAANLAYTQGNYVHMLFTGYTPIVFVGNGFEHTLFGLMTRNTEKFFEGYSELSGINFPTECKSIVINYDLDLNQIDLGPTMRSFYFNMNFEELQNLASNLQNVQISQLSSEVIRLLKPFEDLPNFYFDFNKVSDTVNSFDYMSNKAYHHFLRLKNSEKELPPGPRTILLNFLDIQNVSSYHQLQELFKTKYPEYTGVLFIKPTDRAGGVLTGLLDSDDSFDDFYQRLLTKSKNDSKKLESLGQILLNSQFNMLDGLPIEDISSIFEHSATDLCLEITIDVSADFRDTYYLTINKNDSNFLKNHSENMKKYGRNVDVHLKVFDKKLLATEFVVQEKIEHFESNLNLPRNIGLTINISNGQVESYFSTMQIYRDATLRHYCGSSFDEEINKRVLGKIGDLRIRNLVQMYLDEGYPSNGTIEFDMVLGQNSKKEILYYDIYDNNLRVTASFDIMAIRQFLKSQDLEVKNIANLGGLLNLGKSGYRVLEGLKSLNLLYTAETQKGIVLTPHFSTISDIEESPIQYEMYLVNVEDREELVQLFKQIKLFLADQAKMNHLPEEVYF